MQATIVKMGYFPFASEEKKHIYCTRDLFLFSNDMSNARISHYFRRGHITALSTLSKLIDEAIAGQLTASPTQSQSILSSALWPEDQPFYCCCILWPSGRDQNSLRHRWSSWVGLTDVIKTLHCLNRQHVIQHHMLHFKNWDNPLATIVVIDHHGTPCHLASGWEAEGQQACSH